MICQVCGVEAPTKQVAFYQNIGALVIRFSKTIKGNLCKSCIHKTFWKFTLIDLTLGWWGVISCICTPFFVLNNVFRYLSCIGMPPVPPGAVQPVLTQDAINVIQAKQDILVTRLNAGEPIEKVASDISGLTGVTPGQVLLYVQALANAAKAR